MANPNLTNDRCRALQSDLNERRVQHRRAPVRFVGVVHVSIEGDVHHGLRRSLGRVFPTLGRTLRRAAAAHIAEEVVVVLHNQTKQAPFKVSCGRRRHRLGELGDLLWRWPAEHSAAPLRCVKSFRALNVRNRALQSALSQRRCDIIFLVRTSSEEKSSTPSSRSIPRRFGDRCLLRAWTPKNENSRSNCSIFAGGELKSEPHGWIENEASKQHVSDDKNRPLAGEWTGDGGPAPMPSMSIVWMSPGPSSRSCTAQQNWL